MDVSELLSRASQRNSDFPADTARQGHQYSTRHSNMPYQQSGAESPLQSPKNAELAASSDSSLPSLARGHPKAVTFQAILSEDREQMARLPLRIHIQPHDTTESIVTTVKNFFGVYEGASVSFEDDQGHTLIARYENLSSEQVIHVRVRRENPDENSASPRRATRLDEPFQLQPSYMCPPFARPGSRAAKKRSLSPTSNKGIQTGSLARNRPELLPGAHPRISTANNMSMEMEIANGFSDSDGGSASVSSSRRAKSDHLATAEISVDNIVDGGRRKRAFESSELPLFIPPQVPMQTSISSMSPQRRIHNPNILSPSAYNNQNAFQYYQPLPSPQSYGYERRSNPATHSSSNYSASAAQAAGHRLRARTSSNYPAHRYSSGILPTPDPTIGSVISDEDVALQLMRLGDASNFSLGRTSNSTGDDALSGKADIASSGEETDGDESNDEDSQAPHPRHRPSGSTKVYHNGGPARKKQRGHTQTVPTFDSGESSEEYDDEPAHGSRRASIHGSMKGSMIPKKKSGSKNSTSITNGQAGRKSSAGSSGSIPYANGDDDLSSKPRCQRCRKSKKGCDRQRPCQRCADAGIGIEGCVSEDEGNGRKGRYGRHMGVPVKKEPGEIKSGYEQPLISPQQNYLAASMSGADKNKKRKR